MKTKTATCAAILLLSAAVHAEKPHVYPHRNLQGRANAAATVGSNPKHWGAGTIYNPSGYLHGSSFNLKRAQERDRARAASPGAVRMREKAQLAAQNRRRTKAKVQEIKRTIKIYADPRTDCSANRSIVNRLRRELQSAEKEAYKYDKRKPVSSPVFHYTP